MASPDPSQPGHRWPAGSVVTWYLPDRFAGAARRAIQRWNVFTAPLGIRLKAKGLWPWQKRSKKLGDGVNAIYFTPLPVNWSEEPNLLTDAGNYYTETDVCLSSSKPYDTAAAAYVCCLHEIGHCLGIGHLPALNSIMNARGPAHIKDLFEEDPALVVLKRIYSRKLT